MATLIKEGRWKAQKRTPNGRVVAYGRTAEEAELLLKAKLEPHFQTFDDRQDHTLQTFVVEVWRPHIGNLEPKTIARYTSSWRKFIKPSLANLELRQINFLIVNRWRDHLIAQGVPLQSVRYAGTVLSNILNLAAKSDLIIKNPVTQVELPKKTPKRERVMSPAEAAELFSRLEGTELACPVFLSLVLGMRLGEVAALKWSDIDRQTGAVIIRRQRQAQSGKGVVSKKLKSDHSRRTLRIRRDMLDKIDQLGDLDNEYVCAKDGKPWVPNTIYKKWAESKNDLGFPNWTFHDLRHGSAGLLYAAGCDLLEIAAILGHSKPDMSWLYTSVSEKRSEQAFNNLGELLRIST